MKKIFILFGLIAVIDAWSQVPTYKWKGGSQVTLAGPNLIKTGPGPRQGASSFTDSEGNYWLFGGFGHDFTSSQGYMNDLWKYDRNSEVWTWVDGQMSTNKAVPTYNNSLAFDGVDDYVILSENPLKYDSTFTIELWFKTNQTGDLISFSAENTGDPNQGWGLAVTTNEIWVTKFNNQITASFPTVSLTDNQWHHVAITFDPGDNLFNGQTMTAYLDGQLVGSQGVGFTFNQNFTTQFTYIGANRGNGTSDHFKGQIDEVRFWSYVRNAGEILSNHTIEISGNEDGLEAYYDFNQGQANSSGNYNDVVLDKTENEIEGIRNSEIYREGIFIGKMAKMRTWSYALSEVEVKNAARSSVTGSETDLAMAYQFDNGNASITPYEDNTAVTFLNDLSTGDDGFLNNFTLNGTGSNFVEGAFNVLPYSYSSQYDGSGIVLADLNNDTFDDVVTSNGNNNSINVFLNDQSGQLNPRVEHSVGTNARDIATGFFNNDLIPDIAVAAWATSGDEVIRVFFGNGTGGFSSSSDISLPIDSEPNVVKTADFNGDTFDDIAVLLRGERSIEIHFGDGNGSFPTSSSTSLVYGSLNNGFLVDDFNSDGYPDIAATLIDDLGNNCGYIGTFINDQTGLLTLNLFPNDGGCLYASRIQATDFNNDGNKDIILVDGSSLFSFRGNGDGTFINQANFLQIDDTHHFILEDVNNDNIKDVIGTSWQDRTLTVYLGNTQGGFVKSEKVSVPGDPNDIIAGDLDKNGYIDFATSHYTNYTSVVLREGDFFTQPTITPSLDFDGIDDYIDIPNLKVFDGDFTIEGWVKTEDNGPIFAFTNNNPLSEWNTGHFALVIKNSRLTLMINGYGDIEAYSEQNITNGDWHHVAVSISFDGAGNETIVLYVDGIQVRYESGYDIESGIDNANGSFSAKLGYAAMDFKNQLGSTGLSPNSNFVSGVPFPENYSGRAYAAEWSVGDDFYLFGGQGLNGIHNSIRVYNAVSKTWTTIKGTDTPNDPGSYGTLNIPDASNTPPARFIVDGTLDSNGNYWVFGGAASENPTTWYNDLWVYDSENNEWTWRGGSQSVNQLPVYGTQGVPDISNIPGARENHLIWSDELGNLWLFGGYGLDINGAVGHLNDLWKYSITDAQWTWLGGNDEANQGGTHGVLGEATSGSYPGARASALQWINSNGIVWIFGGQGYDKFGVSAEYLNDLWSYDPSTNQWIWHSGSDFANSTGSYNETGLSSTAYVPGSRWHGSNWIDNEDNLYLFGGYLFNQTTTGRYNDFWKYEPTTKEWTWISGVNATTEIDDIGTYGDIQIGSKPFPGARHGGLTWTDPAGDFWMLGGAFFGSSRGMLTDLWKYEPEKDEWNYIRGSTEMILNNGVYGARGIGNPSNEPRSRWHGSSWLGDDGRLWFFGGLNINQSTNNTAWLNDLWVYDPASDIYTWMGGSSDINGDAVYGIKGQASAAHVPGARSSAAQWKDDEGNFWLFGGYESFEYNNDLWKFNPNTLQWTWVSGNNFQNTPGTYGELGVPDPSNEIGARRYTEAMVAKDGNIWIFGGQGYDSQGQFGYLNDLWKYDPITNIWTWMGGNTKLNLIGNYGTKGVAHPDNLPPSRYAHTTWVDDSGNLWVMGGVGVFGDNNETSSATWLNDLWKYDINTNLWTWIGGSDSNEILAPVFGTQDVFDENNIIRARERIQKFEKIDKSFFLFGGRQGAGSSYNDFWEIKFTPGLADIDEPSEVLQNGFAFGYDEAWTREFRLQVALSDDFSDTFYDERNTEKNVVINNLTPGTHYYYRMDAINEIGNSGFGATQQVLTLPATPTFVSPEAAFSDLTSTQVYLNWEVTEGILDGYYIDVSQDPTFMDAALVHEDFDSKSVPVVESQEILNLTPGTRYYARLQSYNESGVSPFSQVVPFLTKPATVIYPEEEVTDVTQVSAIVNWEPVPEIINNYRITVSTVDDGFADETQFLANYNRRNVTKDKNSIIVTGLAPGTSYYAVVSAVNASGESEQPLKITILTAPSSPVFDVESSILSITQNEVTFSWQAPQGFFEGYYLEISTDFSFANTNLMLVDYGRGGIPFELEQSELTTTVDELLPGQTYFARIRAFNNAGVSPNSNILAFSTVPRAPTLNDPNNISQVGASINWQATLGADLYLIDLNESDDFAEETALLTNFPVAVPFQIFENLTPGTRYYVRVQSNNTSGNSGDMDPADYGFANFITIPADPILDGVNEYTQTSFTVSWPAVDGASAYEVDVSENFFQTFLVGYNGISIADPQIQVADLDAGSEYQIRVRAKNESGKSANAGIFDLLTLPGTPTARDATNSSASVFTANWDPSAGADYYALEVSSDNFNSFHYNEQLSSSNPIQITNLTAGFTYKYRIKAGNASGESPYSGEITVVAQNTSQSLSISSLTFNEKFGEAATSAVVNVKFSGGLGDPNVTIRHKEILSNNWSDQKPMSEISPTEFEFTILSNMLDDIGVVFEISADDGVTFLKQTNNTIKRTFTDTNSESLPLLNLGEWSMVSIPYVLDDNLVTSIFNELGDLTYKKRWRLMTYLDGEYQDQGVGFTRIDLGRGYWFNSLNDVKINVGAGQTNSTIPFEMALAQGWNQIGNPYNVNINWDNILDDNNLSINISKLVIYDPNTREFEESSTLAPFKGAFVFADQAATISVNPIDGFGGGRKTNTDNDFTGHNWKKTLRLHRGGLSTEVAAIGMHDDGEMSKDRFDKLVIPRFENYIEMYTRDNSYFYPKFTNDIKSHQNEYVWNFDLESNYVSGYVSIEWNPEIMKNGRIWLVDEDGGRIIEMDKQESYSFNFDGNHQFSIHYSNDPDYVVTPSRLSLGDAYPNPANSIAYIPISLPKSENRYELRLDLFDIQGKLVQTIVRGSFDSGLHIFELNVENNSVLNDGIYFYKVSFENGGLKDQQKKILIKR